MIGDKLELAACSDWLKGTLERYDWPTARFTLPISQSLIAVTS